MRAGWLAIATLWAVMGCASPLHAQTPPGESTSTRITLVVPFAAGGGVDTIGRLVAERLQERLKQSVVVENRAGGGGVIGVDSAAKAVPDGRTLLLIDSSVVLHKWLHKNVPFDVVADLAPVALVATTPLLLFANPSLPVHDVKELIAHAKANPGKLAAGTPGVGSPHHLAALMLNAAAGIDITHVPYRGTAPALNDLLGGQIPLIWATPIALLHQVEAGKAKALGTASAARIALLPQVPTIAENALPGFNVDVWFGVAAPAKTPSDVVERISREIAEIGKLPDVQKRLATLGYDPAIRGSEQFRELIAAEHARYGKVIRDAGIVPN
jgi:tripartite-type tricarboxylate transporter receptor subunit TctC